MPIPIIMLLNPKADQKVTKIPIRHNQKRAVKYKNKKSDFLHIPKDDSTFSTIRLFSQRERTSKDKKLRLTSITWRWPRWCRRFLVAHRRSDASKHKLTGCGCCKNVRNDNCETDRGNWWWRRYFTQMTRPNLHYLRSSMLEEGAVFELNSPNEERTLKLNGKEWQLNVGSDWNSTIAKRILQEKSLLISTRNQTDHKVNKK